MNKVEYMSMNDLSVELEERVELNRQIVVRCKKCAHDVTKAEHAAQPHEHTFRNPAGYSFHVLCYSEAAGAGDVGIPTTEACWFPGYAWTFAICRQCNEHLGWWYTGEKRFAGLIATRLIR